MPWQLWILSTIMFASVAYIIFDGLSTNPQSFTLLCLFGAGFLYLQNRIEKLESAVKEQSEETQQLRERWQYWIDKWNEDKCQGMHTIRMNRQSS